jgi:hypothetical protein
MSKRHTSSRRRTYGRRQHELHERVDRRQDRARGEHDWPTTTELAPGFDRGGYVEARATEPPYGFAD